MKECIQPYYVRDGELLECETFDLAFINEGKTIYEVSRLAGTQLLFLEDHLGRFFTSLSLEGFNSHVNTNDVRYQLDMLIENNSAKEGNVKFVMNRDVHNRLSFFAYFTQHRYPSAEEYRRGLKVITFPFQRIEPNKKVWRPDFRSSVAGAIRENGAWEAFLLDANDSIPEASKSNIFGIKNGEVITPPDEYILTGITRKYVIEACRALDIPVRLRMIGLGEINQLDAIFMTSTSLQVIPVRQVDDIILPVENKTIGMIREQFEKTIREYLGKTG